MAYSYNRTAALVHTKSPGRGQSLDGKGSHRLQFVDRGADPAEPNHYHFYRRERVKTRSKGKLLKRPRKILEDPGADEGVVGYVDYGKYGSQIEIDLVVVRDDYRSRGIAKKLVAKLYGTPGLKYMKFGRVLNPTAWKLYQWALKKYPKITTTGGKFF